jgi:hemoglobin
VIVFSKVSSTSLSSMSDPLPSSLFARVGGREPLLKLLRYFYADVRQHREIGPIFNAQIKDWPAHISKIADFWSGVTGGPMLYSGPMPWKHVPLGLQEPHFQAWLDLWRRHCRAHLSEAEATELIQRAELIGDRLREIVASFRPPVESEGR